MEAVAIHPYYYDMAKKVIKNGSVLLKDVNEVFFVSLALDEECISYSVSGLSIVKKGNSLMH